MSGHAPTPVISPVSEALVEAVWAFFERIPEGDRTFFKEPVLGIDTVRGWIHVMGASRFVASADDRVVGYVAVIPGVGWSAHVGELRLVVDPEVRRQGLGNRLARHGLVAALEQGLSKVVVEVVSDQTSTIALFAGLGFVAEALLEDQVRDGDGRLNDLIVLAHRPTDNWRLLSTVGLDHPLD
jgi:ribosomal protein S18 acetylase RimI-like enzyme